MLKNRITCAALIALSAAVYVWTNVKLSFYFLVLTAAAALLAVLSNRLGMRRLTADVVTTNDEAAAGAGHQGNSSIVIHFRNESIFPLFGVKVKLIIHNLLTGSSFVTEETYFLLPREERDEVIDLESLYIGRVETDIISVEGTDAFGLSRFSAKAVSRGSFDRYPQLGIINEEIESRSSESNKSMDRYLHRKGNDPTEVLDIRDYRRGDSVKRIHWKLSAKLRKTMVRELDMPSDQDTLVVFGLSEPENGALIDSVISHALNLSWNLLRQEVHHSFLVLDEAGGLLQNFDITSYDSYLSMSARLLAGGIGVSAGLVNAFMEAQHLTEQYSHVFYVTDSIPEYRLSDDIDYLIPEE